MSKSNDPQGIAAERIKLNARVVSLSSAINNYVGDANGLKDLQLRNSEASFRLNIQSTVNGFTSTAEKSSYTWTHFGVGGVSTD